MKKQVSILVLISTVFIFTLACVFTGVATPDQNLQNTQQALAWTQTAMSNPPDQNPPVTQPTDDNSSLVSTQVAMALTQTAMSSGPGLVLPTAVQSTAVPPQADIQSLINSARILVYEDVAGSAYYRPYVKEALKALGLTHTYVADAMGTYMNEMNSGTKWDLIIMASELRTNISGDYWTVLKQKVDGGSALVAEMWYLDNINAGKIAPFLTECGIGLQKDWWGAAVYNPINYGMYWIVPNSPVFNTPNKVNAFRNSLTVDAPWTSGDLGDILQVTDPNKAQILASLHADNDGREGLLASCMNGTVIFQTFSSHNYPTNDMVSLWQNYIIYTLTNHFTNR